MKGTDMKTIRRTSIVVAGRFLILILLSSLAGCLEEQGKEPPGSPDTQARDEGVPSGSGAAQSGDAKGWTPLHYAAWRGNTQEIDQLVAKGADVHAKTKAGDTALYWAVINQHKAAVVLLLSHGADVNARNSGGRTALHEAADNGDLEIAEILLDKDANVDAQSGLRYTPLHGAAYRNHADVAGLLARRGANVQLREHRGLTAFRIAAGRRHTDVVEVLLRYYEPYLKTDSFKNLKKMLVDQLVTAVEFGFSDRVKGMLDRNPDLIRARNDKGKTLIEIAVLNGKHSIVEVLIAKGVDVTKVRSGSWTLLHSATLRAHVRVAEVLIREGVDVNAQISTGDSALHFAITYIPTGASTLHGDYLAMPMVKLLVSKGSDVNMANTKGETPLQRANALRRKRIASFLREHGAK